MAYLCLLYAAMFGAAAWFHYARYRNGHGHDLTPPAMTVAAVCCVLTPSFPVAMSVGLASATAGAVIDLRWSRRNRPRHR